MRRFTAISTYEKNLFEFIQVILEQETLSLRIQQVIE